MAIDVPDWTQHVTVDNLSVELLPVVTLPLQVFAVGGPYGQVPIFNRFGAKGIVVFVGTGAPSAGNYSVIVNECDSGYTVANTIMSNLAVPDIPNMLTCYPGAAGGGEISAHIGAYFAILLNVAGAPCELSVSYVLLP